MEDIKNINDIYGPKLTIEMTIQNQMSLSVHRWTTRLS